MNNQEQAAARLYIINDTPQEQALHFLFTDINGNQLADESFSVAPEEGGFIPLGVSGQAVVSRGTEKWNISIQDMSMDYFFHMDENGVVSLASEKREEEECSGCSEC